MGHSSSKKADKAGLSVAEPVDEIAHLEANPKQAHGESPRPVRAEEDACGESAGEESTEDLIPAIGGKVAAIRVQAEAYRAKVQDEIIKLEKEATDKAGGNEVTFTENGVCTATYLPHVSEEEAAKAGIISAHSGEQLYIIVKDAGGWAYAHKRSAGNEPGIHGWLPSSHVAELAKCAADHVSEALDGLLNLKQGDLVEVLNRHYSGWTYCREWAGPPLPGCSEERQEGWVTDVYLEDHRSEVMLASKWHRLILQALDQVVSSSRELESVLQSARTEGLGDQSDIWLNQCLDYTLWLKTELENITQAVSKQKQSALVEGTQVSAMWDVAANDNPDCLACKVGETFIAMNVENAEWVWCRRSVGEGSAFGWLPRNVLSSVEEPGEGEPVVRRRSRKASSKRIIELKDLPPWVCKKEKCKWWSASGARFCDARIDNVDAEKQEVKIVFLSDESCWKSVSFSHFGLPVTEWLVQPHDDRGKELRDQLADWVEKGRQASWWSDSQQRCLPVVIKEVCFKRRMVTLNFACDMRVKKVVMMHELIDDPDSCFLQKDKEGHEKRMAVARPKGMREKPKREIDTKDLPDGPVTRPSPGFGSSQTQELEVEDLKNEEVSQMGNIMSDMMKDLGDMLGPDQPDLSVEVTMDLLSPVESGEAEEMPEVEELEKIAEAEESEKVADGAEGTASAEETEIQPPGQDAVVPDGVAKPDDAEETQQAKEPLEDEAADASRTTAAASAEETALFDSDAEPFTSDPPAAEADGEQASGVAATGEEPSAIEVVADYSADLVDGTNLPRDSAVADGTDQADQTAVAATSATEDAVPPSQEGGEGAEADGGPPAADTSGAEPDAPPSTEGAVQEAEQGAENAEADYEDMVSRAGSKRSTSRHPSRQHPEQQIPLEALFAEEEAAAPQKQEEQAVDVSGQQGEDEKPVQAAGLQAALDAMDGPDGLDALLEDAAPGGETAASDKPVDAEAGTAHPPIHPTVAAASDKPVDAEAGTARALEDAAAAEAAPAAAAGSAEAAAADGLCAGDDESGGGGAPAAEAAVDGGRKDWETDSNDVLQNIREDAALENLLNDMASRVQELDRATSTAMEASALPELDGEGDKIEAEPNPAEPAAALEAAAAPAAIAEAAAMAAAEPPTGQLHDTSDENGEAADEYLGSNLLRRAFRIVEPDTWDSDCEGSPEDAKLAEDWSKIEEEFEAVTESKAQSYGQLLSSKTDAAIARIDSHMQDLVQKLESSANAAEAKKALDAAAQHRARSGDVQQKADEAKDRRRRARDAKLALRRAKPPCDKQLLRQALGLDPPAEAEAVVVWPEPAGIADLSVAVLLGETAELARSIFRNVQVSVLRPTHVSRNSPPHEEESKKYPAAPPAVVEPLPDCKNALEKLGATLTLVAERLQKEKDGIPPVDAALEIVAKGEEGLSRDQKREKAIFEGQQEFDWERSIGIQMAEVKKRHDKAVDAALQRADRVLWRRWQRCYDSLRPESMRQLADLSSAVTSAEAELSIVRQARREVEEESARKLEEERRGVHKQMQLLLLAASVIRKEKERMAAAWYKEPKERQESMKISLRTIRRVKRDVQGFSFTTDLLQQQSVLLYSLRVLEAQLMKECPSTEKRVLEGDMETAEIKQKLEAADQKFEEKLAGDLAALHSRHQVRTDRAASEKASKLRVEMEAMFANALPDAQAAWEVTQKEAMHVDLAVNALKPFTSFVVQLQVEAARQSRIEDSAWDASYFGPRRKRLAAALEESLKVIRSLQESIGKGPSEAGKKAPEDAEWQATISRTRKKWDDFREAHPLVESSGGGAEDAATSAADTPRSADAPDGAASLDIGDLADGMGQGGGTGTPREGGKAGDAKGAGGRKPGAGSRQSAAAVQAPSRRAAPTKPPPSRPPGPGAGGPVKPSRPGAGNQASAAGGGPAPPKGRARALLAQLDELSTTMDAAMGQGPPAPVGAGTFSHPTATAGRGAPTSPTFPGKHP